MWKIILLALFGIIAAVSAQDVEFECRFSLSFINEYHCTITNVTLSDRESNVTITGTHLNASFTNDDVDVLVINNSHMEFIPSILYETFPNINEAVFLNAGLQEISQLPELSNLRWFEAIGNNITTIENNTFINVGETLFQLQLTNDNIQTLDVDSFAGLSNLIYLYIYFNNMAPPPVGTFDHLTSLQLIDFDSSNFGVIDDTLFRENRELRAIFAERNGIDRISPTFSAPFIDTLVTLYLWVNECTDRGFLNDDEVAVAFMNSALQGCYNNFLEREGNATRTITFEYRGSLRLFDEFGNLILSAN
jgi:hypothetical protein